MTQKQTSLENHEHDQALESELLALLDELVEHLEKDLNGGVA